MSERRPGFQNTPKSVFCSRDWTLWQSGWLVAALLFDHTQLLLELWYTLRGFLPQLYRIFNFSAVFPVDFKVLAKFSLKSKFLLSRYTYNRGFTRNVTLPRGIFYGLRAHWRIKQVSDWLIWVRARNSVTLDLRKYFVSLTGLTHLGGKQREIRFNPCPVPKPVLYYSLLQKYLSWIREILSWL